MFGAHCTYISGLTTEYQIEVDDILEEDDMILDLNGSQSRPTLDLLPVKRVYSEISLLQTLSHPNIADVLEVTEILDKQEVKLYQAVKDGMISLKHHVLFNGTTEDQLLTWGHEICQGMEYLHSRNILHRGLSIRSVFLKDNVAKICDLETAVHVQRMVVTYSSGGNSVGARPIVPIRGINTYHTPRECVISGNFVRASDVWAFGVTMLEILNAGVYPFGKVKSKVIENCIAEGGDILCLVEVDISNEIMMSIVKPALRVDPNRRHSFAALSETFVELKQKTFPFEVLAGKDKCCIKPNYFQVHLNFRHCDARRSLGVWRKQCKKFLQKKIPALRIK